MIRVGIGNGKRIEEHGRGLLEAHPVLREIRHRLLRVPNVLHSRILLVARNGAGATFRIASRAARHHAEPTKPDAAAERAKQPVQGMVKAYGLGCAPSPPSPSRSRADDPEFDQSDMAKFRSGCPAIQWRLSPRAATPADRASRRNQSLDARSIWRSVSAPATIVTAKLRFAPRISLTSIAYSPG